MWLVRLTAQKEENKAQKASSEQFFSRKVKLPERKRSNPGPFLILYESILHIIGCKKMLSVGIEGIHNEYRLLSTFFMPSKKNETD